MCSSDILIIHIDDDVSIDDGTLVPINFVIPTVLELSHTYSLASWIRNDHRTTVRSLSDKLCYSLQHSTIYHDDFISANAKILFYVKNDSVSATVESNKGTVGPHVANPNRIASGSVLGLCTFTDTGKFQVIIV
jgi:hypothetical protein